MSYIRIKEVRKINKIFSILLSVLMIVSVLPSYVWGEIKEESTVGKKISITVKNYIDENDITNISDITITDTDGMSAAGSIVDDKYEVELDADKEWKCSVEAAGYDRQENISIPLDNPEEDIIVISLFPEKKYSDNEITGTIYDSQNNPICNTEFIFQCDKYKENIITVTTEADGSYRIEAGENGGIITNYGQYVIMAENYKNYILAEFEQSGQDIVLEEKEEQEGFAFEEQNPGSKAFEGGANVVEYQNKAAGGQVQGKIVYEIKSVQDLEGKEVEADKKDDIATIEQEGEREGILTVKMPCKITVEAALEGDNTYKKASAEYTLTVEKGTQAALKFNEESPSISFTDKENTVEYTNTATGGTLTGNIVYSIKSVSVDGTEIETEKIKDVVTIDEATSTLIIKQSCVIKVMATLAGNKYYNKATAEYTLTVGKGEQAALKFNETGPITKQYGSGIYQNEATGGSGTGEIIYQSSDKTVAVVDEKTGEVTFLKAGEVKITATKSGDDRYGEISTSYTLVVERGEQEPLKFDEIAPSKKICGEKYTNKATGGSGNGNITYSSSNTEIAEVDSDGNITTKKSGKVTITAVKAEDKQYSAISAKYELTIEYFKVINPSEIYEIMGEHKNDSGWYTGAVNIKAKSGYALSISQLADATNEWKSLLENVMTEDGIISYTFYAKNSSGGISEAISIELKRDTNNPEIEIDMEAPNSKGYYNKDVDADISISDLETSSGIKSVEYWVTSDKLDGRGNIETQRGTLYTHESTIIKEYKNKVAIIANNNNSDNVCLYVKVIDISGNETIKNTSLKIDTVLPEIEVSFDNNNYSKISDGAGYYRGRRMATIVITERSSGFDAEEATKGIAITAKDLAGRDVELTGMRMIGEWRHEEGASLDKATHTINVSFAADANYTFDIGYTDNAGNSNKAVLYGESQTPNRFTIDNTKPAGIVTIKEKGTWSRLPEVITFGLWSGNTLWVDGSSADDTSPMETVLYYKTSDTNVKTEKELDSITDWRKFSPLEISVNERAVIYLKLQDYAGNVTYISTNGVISDNKAPVADIIIEDTENGIYNDNVNIGISVEEIVDGDIYSGIGNVTYEIYNRGSLTQSGILYEFDKINPLFSELRKSYTGNITVNKELNNSNEVEVRVYAADNSGNRGIAVKDIKIDTTSPEITVTYDNNNGDAAFDDGIYFKENRIATVQIVERNFNADKVKITITNTLGNVPAISGWTTNRGTENEDNTLHTATIVFSEDGDYFFDISYVDEAGNGNNGVVNYNNSLAPTEFTIDKTSPVIEVTYDNNNVKNGSYYADDRIATIMVNEHNFETSRMEILIVAEDNGQEIQAPVVGEWQSSGDEHRAVVSFSDDAFYTMSISYRDKAGNDSNVIEAQSFYVDKTAPAVSVSGIGNQSANNADGDIGFILQCTDTNLDIFNPELTTLVSENGKYVNKKIEGVLTEITNGMKFTINNLESDGIYTLKCKITDKAGNTFEVIFVTDEAGKVKEIDREEDDTLITFSVNRSGSAFSLGNSTLDLVDRYYVQNLSEDITIIEVNVDPLKEYVIKHNEVILKEGTDYTVDMTGGAEEWSRYEYTINKSLFEEEGENNIVVESVDKADTMAYSDVKNLNLSFVVDRTAPSVTISGIDDNGSYQTTEQTVLAIPVDDGGKLNSFKAIVLDENEKPLSDKSGEDVSVRFDMSGDEFINYLEDNDGKVTFTVPEGMNNKVQIICNDCSVNSEGKTNEWQRTYTGITVSQSGLVIFYANKPLFYGVIAGGVSVVAAVVAAIIMIRKRKIKKIK